MSCGADVETLNALAMSAKINKEDPPVPLPLPTRSMFAGIDLSTLPIFADELPSRPKGE